MSKEALPWVLAESWRTVSNRLYAEIEHIQSAPALFKPEYVRRVTAEFRVSDEQFNFWYKNLTGI